MDNAKQIVEALLEIKKSSLLHKNPCISIKGYSIMASDLEGRSIDTSELGECLSHCYNINISTHELVSMIPQICRTLNMKYESFKASKNPLTDSGELHYTIFLW